MSVSFFHRRGLSRRVAAASGQLPGLPRQAQPLNLSNEPASCRLNRVPWRNSQRQAQWHRQSGCRAATPCRFPSLIIGHRTCRSKALPFKNFNRGLHDHAPHWASRRYPNGGTSVWPVANWPKLMTRRSRATCHAVGNQAPDGSELDGRLYYARTQCWPLRSTGMSASRWLRFFRPCNR